MSNSFGSNSTTTQFNIILLAAGSSSRLGRPKQLLRFGDKTLLQIGIQAAIDSAAGSCFVVLGAHADLLINEIDQDHAHLVINADWEEGMASSIRCGLQAALTKAPSTEGVILMVCDQPYVSASLLNELLSAHLSTGKSIIACSYENTFGPPAFFHKSLFAELLLLEGDSGAKKLIQQHFSEAGLVSFPRGAIDIDTEHDFEMLPN